MLASGNEFESRTDANQAAHSRKDGQSDKWHPHAGRRFVWHVRAMFVPVTSASAEVRSHVFVYWSNVLARFMSRTIARRKHSRIVRLQSLVVSGGVCLVGFTANGLLEK